MTESAKPKIFCDECGISFARKDGLLRHNRRAHNGAKAETLACPEGNCNFTCARIFQLDLHLTEVHDRQLEKECHHFKLASEFEEWKELIRQYSYSRYVRVQGKRGRRYVLHCHRSGHAGPSRATGKRPRKKRTIKIGKTCPSRMTVFESNTGVDVVYVKTHFGHDVENLFPEKRKRCTIKFSDEDAVAIESLVQGWKDDGVILYKPQGVTNDDSSYSECDFILAVMNREQSELLKLYGSEFVCFDTSNAIGQYRIFLATLYVLDGTRNAVPVAFFMTNRKDQRVFELFFEAIRSQTGTIATQVFMSDEEPEYHNAWTTVMGSTTKHLLNSWNVQQNWQKHLNNILDSTLRSQLRNELDALHAELDVQIFDMNYPTFLQKIGNDDVTKPLHTCLMQNYNHCVDQWAACHHVQAGVVSRKQLEDLHKSVKKIYFGSKPGKAIGVILDEVRQFVLGANVACGTVVEMAVETACSEQEAMEMILDPTKENHSKSFDGAFNYITEAGDGNYYVRSFTKDFELYYAVNSEKYDCTCAVVCDDCRFCVHRFKCSCLENSINMNICKHIHLVGRWLNESRLESEHNYANETSAALLMLGIDGNIPEKPTELEVETATIDNIGLKITLDHEKQNILSLIQEIKDQCLQTHSLDELTIMKNKLKNMFSNN